MRDLQRRAADRRDAGARRASRLRSALATGHYARLADDGEGPLLAAAADPAKDQTYMLSGLRPGSLARLRFPLAELSKPEVRELAAAAGLAGRRQGGEPGPLLPRRRGQALVPRPPRRTRRQPRPDRRPRADGRLGRHRGHHAYTVGQRRGLGVASAEPLYVLATDAAANTRRRRLPRGAGDATGAGARRHPAPPGRAGRPGAAALPLAPARLRAAGGRARASTRRSSSSSPSPPTASRRARPRACSPATWSSAGRRSPSRPPSSASAPASPRRCRGRRRRARAGCGGRASPA